MKNAFITLWIVGIVCLLSKQFRGQFLTSLPNFETEHTPNSLSHLTSDYTSVPH